jgi:hypothetical protein
MAVGEPDELRVAVDDLLAMDPSPLLGTRGGNVVTQVRPMAWAVEVAADLHRRFPTLDLVVGFLRYPRRVPRQQVDFDAQYSQIPDLDPQIEVALDGPLRVASGHDGYHRVVMTNHMSRPITVWTNGQITAHVVEPATGEVVGLSTTAQTLPGVPFHADPHERIVVPLLVGTVSVRPRLGYRVPPGTWQLRAGLTLTGQAVSDNGYLTPAMPFEIV